MGGNGHFLVIPFFFAFFCPPPSVGGLDLDSRSSGCARLGEFSVKNEQFWVKNAFFGWELIFAPIIRNIYRPCEKK